MSNSSKFLEDLRFMVDQWPEGSDYSGKTLLLLFAHINKLEAALNSVQDLVTNDKIVISPSERCEYAGRIISEALGEGGEG